jgi:hypothetical protein
MLFQIWLWSTNYSIVCTILLNIFYFSNIYSRVVVYRRVFLYQCSCTWVAHIDQIPQIDKILDALIYNRGRASTSRNRHSCSSLLDQYWWHVLTAHAHLISHQPTVLFSQNKPVTSNQPTVLFSQNKPAPVISHQPTEQAAKLWNTYTTTCVYLSSWAQNGLRSHDDEDDTRLS